MEAPSQASGVPASPAATKIEEDEAALFRNSVRDVSPLPPPDKASKSAKARPPPLPRPVLQSESKQPSDFTSSDFLVGIEAGEEVSFSRPGLARQTLRRLRREHWGVDAELDLHGYTRDQAQGELKAFLDNSVSRGFRCVRVIHGKGLGSRNHEPVLKARVGGWLKQRNDVLAFCPARPEHGGSGAVLVLLRSSRGEHNDYSGYKS
ncbi:MAG TPA: Smr/MutS family protein [Nitrosospira sp.]|nr:Smr/MutS family protein [Nitrosospira sp.]